MHERFEKRIEEALVSLAGRLDRAKKKPNRTQVERQIGRLLGKNSRAGGRNIRIRCVTKPDESQRILLSRLGMTLPARLGEPRWENSNGVVVKTLDEKRPWRHPKGVQPSQLLNLG